MDRLRAIALEKAINDQIIEQAEVFQKEILSGCEEDDTYEKIYAKMILNAVKMSIRLSVGIILDVLVDYGIAEPVDEDEARRSIISLIKK